MNRRPTNWAAQALSMACIISLVCLWGCSDQLADQLRYQVADGEVVCTFELDDIREVTRYDNPDLEDIKRAAIRHFQNVDSLQKLDAYGWRLVQLDSNTFQLRKPLSAMGAMQYQHKMLLMKHLNPKYNPSISGLADFGYITAPVPSIVSAPQQDEYHFLLRGFPNARQVVLAGNFNRWNTHEYQMTHTDSGWVYSLKLPPGAYLYRFIVDGRWMQDPANPNQKPNEFDEPNAVFVIPNYRFGLPGYQDAHEVKLAGSFNDWEHGLIPMRRTDEGWEREVYLQDGTYQYKYIVDGKWILDPTNPNKIRNEFDEFNSLLNLGEAQHFALSGYPEASQVILSGSFNNWSQHALPMKRSGDQWIAEYVLPPGNYEYKFIVDGKWITDPANPYLVPNTVGSQNSWLVVGEPYLFDLEGFANAQEVFLTGTFVGWNPHKCRMNWQDSAWHFPVYLSQGKHAYKFVVDGLWMPDPANEYQEFNEHNSLNSIIWRRESLEN